MSGEHLVTFGDGVARCVCGFQGTVQEGLDHVDHLIIPAKLALQAAREAGLIK